MTTPPPDDLDARYDAMKAAQSVSQAIMMSSLPATERDKMVYLYTQIAEANEAAWTLHHAMEEAQRVRKSWALKDILKRVSGFGFVLPDMKDPKAIRAGRAEAVAGYEKAMAEYDARQAELEALQRLKDEQAALSEAQAKRLEELKQQSADITATVEGGTNRALAVKKPLKLKP
ncbi:MAG: hypothetical protein ACAH80_07715 [Alphaproteobacteria bacterium]